MMFVFDNVERANEPSETEYWKLKRKREKKQCNISTIDVGVIFGS